VNENGSSTKILMDLITSQQHRIDELEKRYNILENKLIVIENERQEYQRKDIPGKIDTLWGWHQGLREDKFGEYWHHIRRLVDAFEKDKLFEVIYNSRNVQKYLGLILAAMATAAGTYIWSQWGQ